MPAVSLFPAFFLCCSSLFPQLLSPYFAFYPKYSSSLTHYVLSICLSLTSFSLWHCLPDPGCLNVSCSCWASAEHQDILPPSWGRIPSIDLSQPTPCVWLKVCVCVAVHMCSLRVSVPLLHMSLCLSPALTGVCTLCLMSFFKWLSDCVWMCGRPGVSWYLCRHVCPLSIPVPHTCLWLTCVALVLTPAFVNRGRKRAQVIGAQKEREWCLHWGQPSRRNEGEVDRWTAGGKKNQKLIGKKWVWKRRKDNWIWRVCRDGVGSQG